MARVTFDSVFKRHPDDSLEPLQKIRVGGVTFGPGVRFSSGVSFGTVDFTQFIGHDFEVETDKDTLVIKGIYGNNQS